MSKEYIIPKVRVLTSSIDQPLTEALTNFLQHPTKCVLLIQGLSRMGKSASLSYIKGYTAQHNILTHLILLSLYTEDDFHSEIKDPIIKLLHHKKWPKDSQQIRVLLLDGQDELKNRKGLFNIYQNNQLQCWKNLKVIITCRQEILPANYRHFFKPNKEVFVEWELLPLNSEQQRSYIAQLLEKYHDKNQYINLNLELYMHILSKLPINLTGNPLLLRFCLKGILSLLTQVKKKTILDLNLDISSGDMFSHESSSAGSSSSSLTCIHLKASLENEWKYVEILNPYLLKGFTLGKASTQGDCFFDSLAQSLNFINSVNTITDKYLRIICHDYYGNNKLTVDKLNSNDSNSTYENEDYNRIQYTAKECQEQFNGKSPIWGRPAVEGIILCNQLNLQGFCIVEILENPETKQSILSFYWVNNKSYSSIDEQKGRECFQNPQIPILIVEQNSLHFVPVIKDISTPILLKNSQNPSSSKVSSIPSSPVLINRHSLRPLSLQFTRYQIFTAAIKQQFSNVGSYNLSYVQEMALHMWVNRGKIFHSKNWTLDLFPQTSALLPLINEAEKKRILLHSHRQCLIITQSSTTHKAYQFKHTSIQEYLAASWLLNYLKPENLNFILLNNLLINYKITPGVLLSDKGILKFLLEELNTPQGEILKVVLNKIVLASRQNKNLSPLSAFAITLLNSAGKIFSHLDYQRINIAGAILHNSCCYHTLFQHCDLSQVDFQGADLTLANFQGSQMREINFGQYPTYQTAKQGIYQFSRDVNQLLIGSWDGEINIFSLITNQVEKTYQPDKDASKITNLWWENNLHFIFSQHENGRTYLIEQKTDKIIPFDFYSFRSLNTLAFAINKHKKLIIVGYDEDYIKLFQYEDGCFKSHSSVKALFPIDCIVLNNDSHLIAGNSSGDIALYHFVKKNWLLVRKFNLQDSYLGQMLFIAEENAFITCGGSLIKLWDANTGEFIKAYAESSASQKYALHYDYPYIAAGDDLGNIYIWHINSIEPFRQIVLSNNTISALQILTKDNLIVGIDENGKITKHSFSKEFITLEKTSVNYCKGEIKIGLSSNEKYMISARTDNLYLQDLNSWQLLKKISLDNLKINHTMINSDGTIILASGHYVNPLSNYIYCLAIFDNGREYWLKNKNEITAIFITPNNRFVIFGDEQGNVIAWNLEQEKIMWVTALRSQSHITKIIEYLKEDSVVVLTNLSPNSVINFLNINNGRSQECYDVIDRAHCVLISESGKYLVASYAGCLYLWNRTVPLKPMIKFTIYKDNLDDIAINQDATIIAGTCAAKSSILIWRREGETLQLHGKIIHPDKPCQVFLFEDTTSLKLISRSKTGSVRHWLANKSIIPFQFNLINENGHYQLSLRNAKVDGTQELSRDNLYLLHQSKVQGYPYVNSDLYHSQLIPDPNRVFFITDWQPLFIGKENNYQLLHSPQFKAFKILLSIEYENKSKKAFTLSHILSQALIKGFQTIKKINYLDLSDNGLEDIHMELLASALLGKVGFEQMPLYHCNVLILSNNQIGKNGLKTLLEALVTKPSIRQLQLNHNYIDCSFNYLKDQVSHQVQQADLINLGLKYNFIPKGTLIEKNNMRVYSVKGESDNKFFKNPLRTQTKVTFFKPPIALSNYNVDLKVSTPPLLMQVFSLLTSIDKDSPHKKFNIDHGIIGLFVKKTRSNEAVEHAYLFVEGISKFGQRFLICGNLSSKSSGIMDIEIAQWTPQDFLKFASLNENVLFKTSLFTRREIKQTIIAMSQFQNKQSSAKLLNTASESQSCLMWIMEILKEARIEEEIFSWRSEAADREQGQEPGCNIC